MKVKWVVLLLLAPFPYLAVAKGNALDGMIYWTNSGKIQRASADGSHVEDVVSAAGYLPSGIAFDLAHGKMYWTDLGGIRRANLDGTCVEDVVGGLTNARGITVGKHPPKIYWTEAHVSAKKIQRAELDGTAVEHLVTTRGFSYGLALGSGGLYWGNTASAAGGIRWCSLDGSIEQDYLVGEEVWGLALDEAGGYLYWVSRFHIRRGPIDPYGASGIDIVNADTLYDGSGSNLWGIALDLEGGKMYWTEHRGIYFTGIRRANLDGSGLELIVSGLTNPTGIAFLVPEPATLALLVLGGLRLVRRRRR